MNICAYNRTFAQGNTIRYMRTSLSNIVLYVIALITISCNYDHYQEDIDLAFEKCDSAPDSALAILSAIHKEDLSGKVLPAYCLAYTMAQDKSGMDVDNDSLIRIAYLAYAEDPQSQYYSRSQYYMGKYYALNDSIDEAVSCFENTKDRALEEKDTATACLALERLSREIIPYDQIKALEYAKDAYRMYTHFSRSKVLNKVLYKLQVGYCLALSDSLVAALDEHRIAYDIALKSNDSVAISNACQELSVIYRTIGYADSSLIFAKKANSYTGENNSYNQFILADAYYAADSLSLAEEIYKKIVNQTSAIQTVVIYGNLQRIAIRQNDKEQVVAYGDSAIEKLGTMYSASLEQRKAHYENLIVQEKEKDAARHSAYRAKWTICFIFLLLCYIVYMYIMYKRRTQERIKDDMERAELKLQHERDLHEQELSFKEEQHERELQHRDLHISIMQKYLMEKIKIAQKIKDIKDGKKKAIFTDDDWKEIEIFLEIVECEFVSRLRTGFPDLREKDVQLMMLLRVKMPQKCIAEYYGISEKAIKQKLFLYKEKVGIKDENISLREFIEAY